MPDSRAVRVPYSSLTYDRKVCRYRGKSGRFLSPENVRQVIEADIEVTKDRMEALARQAQMGEISISEWRDRQALEIKNLHLAHLAAAKGGFHALDQADFGRAGQIIRGEYGYLNNRAQIAANDPDYLASERFIRDVRGYGDSGLLTFEDVRRNEEVRAGFGWSVNVEDAEAHHCKPKGNRESCQQQTAKGATPDAQMVGVGRRACINKCRCLVRRFQTKEAAEAFADGLTGA